MTHVTVRVPATSANLGPGFDCLGLALDLFNTIALDVEPARASHEATVEIYGAGANLLPRDSRNLALRAARRVLHDAPDGLAISKIVLHNQIPVSGGLGSSAAAIAGAMTAANEALARPYDRETLLRFALEFEPHPDNLAPAFYGGLTVAILDESGHPVVVPLPPPAGLRAVVLTPRLAISTHESRAMLPPQVPHADATFNVGRTALLLSSLLTGRYALLGTAMADRLHQPQRAVAFPAMPHIIDAALKAGAAGAALSGSGPSILALCTENGPDIARAMQQAAAHHDLDSDVRELAIVAAGAQVQ